MPQPLEETLPLRPHLIVPVSAHGQTTQIRERLRAHPETTTPIITIVPRTPAGQIYLAIPIPDHPTPAHHPQEEPTT